MVNVDREILEQVENDKSDCVSYFVETKVKYLSLHKWRLILDPKDLRDINSRIKRVQHMVFKFKEFAGNELANEPNYLKNSTTLKIEQDWEIINSLLKSLGKLEDALWKEITHGLALYPPEGNLLGSTKGKA